MINVAFIILAASCKNNSNPVQPVNPNMVLVDTTGLSKSNYLTDIAKSNPADNNKIANPVINPAAKGKTANTGTPVNGNNNLPPTNKGTTTTTTTTSPATIPADHGWSDAAKGTAIGVGTGVVIGTIVSKNKVNGAIIGGILGGGTGYVIGRSRDRKSGRVGRHRARKRAKVIVN